METVDCSIAYKDGAKAEILKNIDAFFGDRFLQKPDPKQIKATGKRVIVTLEKKLAEWLGTVMDVIVPDLLAEQKNSSDIVEQGKIVFSSPKEKLTTLAKGRKSPEKGLGMA